MVGAGSVTYIEQFSVFAPSSVVTVIIVAPTDTPVTSPFELTSAIFESLLLHTTFLLVASSGKIVAVNIIFL